jgi:hypothetical protein
MADDQSDLIHMGGNHDLFCLAIWLGWFFPNDQAAKRVHMNFIGHSLHFSADDLADTILKAGWAKGIGKLLKKFFHE